MSSSDPGSDSESDAPPPPPPPKRARKQAPRRKAPSFDDSDMDEDMKPSWGKGVQVDGEKKEKKIVYGVRRTDGTGLVGPAGTVYKLGKKYKAQACDRVTGKRPSVGYHETKEAALAAVRVKQATLDEAHEATDVFQAALKATEGLPPSPDKIEEAELGKTYRHQDPKNKFLPYGAVVRRAGKQGLLWTPACAHVDPATGATWTCGNNARQAQKGENTNRCKLHGGGVRCKGAILFTTGEHVPCGYNVSVLTGKKDKYDGRCVRCFCQTEDPNDERVQNARKWMNAKEQEVVKRLLAVFPKYHFVLDEAYCKQYAYGSLKTNFRPDMRTIQHGRILIVEIDELSHITYDCGRERFREEVLRKQGGERMRTIMLRFNPDHYTDLATGLRVPSCFHHNKESNTVVPNPAQKKQWDLRIEALCARIRVFLDRKDPAYMEEVPEPPPGRCIYMEELFYEDVSGVTDAGKAKIALSFKRASQKRKQSEAAASSKEEAPPPQPRRRVSAPVDSDSDSDA